MKRTTAILLSALMLLALAACGQQPAASAPEATPEPAQAPTPVPTPTPTPEPTPIPTEAAAVLLDRVGAVARLYDLGEKVKVVGADEDYYTLSDGLLVERWLIRLDTEEAPAERTAYARGSDAAIPTKLLFFKGDEVTEPWTAYARSNAPFYRNWRTKLDTPEKLAMNTKLEIIGTFGDYLIAQKEDKTVGLIEAAQVSETEIVNYYYGGGPEWSEPAM